MTYRCRIVFLQRFYKQRFRHRQLSSILIQRFTKGHKVFNRWQILLKIAKGARKANLMRQRLMLSETLNKMVRNRAAIKIQAHIKSR